MDLLTRRTPGWLAFWLLVAMVTDTRADSGSICKCNGKLNVQGNGECNSKYGTKWCYVNEGDCPDQGVVRSIPGWFWSRQACLTVCGWYKSCLGVEEAACPLGSLEKCRCVKKNKKTKKTVAKGDGVMVEGKCSCSQFCPKGSNCKAMLYCCGEKNKGNAFTKAATIGGSCD